MDQSSSLTSERVRIESTVSGHLSQQGLVSLKRHFEPPNLETQVAALRELQEIPGFAQVKAPRKAQPRHASRLVRSIIGLTRRVLDVLSPGRLRRLAITRDSEVQQTKCGG